MTIPKSACVIARSTPAAMVSAPAICTKVVNRYSQSSVSKALANQVKFIQAHQMAKNPIAYPMSPWVKWPSAQKWCRLPDARDTATTKTRSNSSSSGVDARCGSAGSRDTMARRPPIMWLPSGLETAVDVGSLTCETAPSRRTW
ncbi:Uncharacterised protein [Mycobacteroides abscessus subsp. abscessus]|nr:Uncharacterised protein [Mycobacteroides abscessus subsp. abscessus]SKZ01388.1 Uncharacterised protein [Mycobacteroides abscessus subsp. abscessus]